jgi:hypothetical protein
MSANLANREAAQADRNIEAPHDWHFMSSVWLIRAIV